MQDTREPSSRAGSYIEEIRRFPRLKAEEEYMTTMRCRERGDESAAHQLLTSHLRLVAKIAITVKNYFVRSWSIVNMDTTANQKIFNLPKAKRRLSALQDVVEMNRRRAFKKVQTAAHTASERMTATAAKALRVRPSLSWRVQSRNARSKLLAFQISTLLAASMVAGPAAAGAIALHGGGAAGGWRGAANGALQGGWQRGWRSGWHGGQNWNGGAGWNRGWDRAHGAASGGTVVNEFSSTNDIGGSCLQAQPVYAVGGNYMGQEIVDVCRLTGIPW